MTIKELMARQVEELENISQTDLTTKQFLQKSQQELLEAVAKEFKKLLKAEKRTWANQSIGWTAIKSVEKALKEGMEK